MITPGASELARISCRFPPWMVWSDAEGRPARPAAGHQPGYSRERQHVPAIEADRTEHKAPRAGLAVLLREPPRAPVPTEKAPARSGSAGRNCGRLPCTSPAPV